MQIHDISNIRHLFQISTDISTELQIKASVSSQEDTQHENKTEDPILKRLATLEDLIKDMFPGKNLNEGKTLTYIIKRKCFSLELSQIKLFMQLH